MKFNQFISPVKELERYQAIDKTLYANFVAAFNRSNQKAPNHYKINIDHFLAEYRKKIINMYDLIGNQVFSVLNSLLLDTPTPLVRFLDNYIMAPLPWLTLFHQVVSPHLDTFKKSALLLLSQYSSAISYLFWMVSEDSLRDLITDMSVCSPYASGNVDQKAVMAYLDQLLIHLLSLHLNIKIEVSDERILSHLVPVVTALNAIRDDYYERAFKELLINYFTNRGGYASFVTNVSHTSKLHQRLALHNADIVKQLQKKGIDTDLAFHYAEKKTFVFGSQYDSEREKFVYPLLTAIKKIQKLVNTVDTTGRRRIKNAIQGINRKIQNFSHQVVKGTKATLNNRPLPANILEKIGNESNTALIDKIVLSTSAIISDLREDIANLLSPQIRIIVEILEFLSNIRNIKRQFNEKTKRFTIQQWDKNRFDTFLLGDQLSCCLATTGSEFPAMIQRWLDDAMFVHVIIDESTQQPVCGAWLFFAEDKDHPDEINVVANFLEIRSSFARDSSLRDALVSNLLKYIGDYTAAIRAKQFLIAPLNYGSIPKTKYFECVTKNLAKAGPAFTYEATDTEQYYLNSLKKNRFYEYDEAALMSEFGDYLSEQPAQEILTADKISVANIQFLLAEIAKHVDVLAHMPSWYLSDFDFMLSAVEINSNAAKYAHYHLRTDFQFALEVYLIDPDAIQFIDITLRNHPVFMRAIISQNWKMLQYGSYVIRSNPEIVELAVKQNWQALRFAGTLLKNNKTFLKEMSKYNWKPLFDCIKVGDTNAFCDLLDRIDIDVNTTIPKTTVTPLYYACQEGASDMVSAILKFDNRSINMPGVKGHTPLQIACLLSELDVNPDIFKVLLQHGADIQHKNDAGQTALDIAASNTNKKVNMVAVLEILNHAKNNNLAHHLIMSDKTKTSLSRWVTKNIDTEDEMKAVKQKQALTPLSAQTSFFVGANRHCKEVIASNGKTEPNILHHNLI